MTICNFCNKRESRSYTFDKPYTCKECCKNKVNYTTADDDIIFILKLHIIKRNCIASREIKYYFISRRQALILC